MKANTIMLSLFCVLLLGCDTDGLTSMPKIEVEIINHSTRELEYAVARFGKYDCKWGRVGKTFSASYMFYPHPITSDAELHWDEPNGLRMEKIDLRKIYPPGKSGRLTFTVYDDRVEVTFREQP